MHKRVRNVPSIVDLDERFRIMDLFDDYAQIICFGLPDRRVWPSAGFDRSGQDRQ